jgi:hypothetical protein
MNAEQAYNKIDHSKPRGGAVALIEAQAGAFKTFNRSSLSFTHNLVNHPLFELPRLAKLAQTVIDAKGQSYVLSRVAESVPNIRKQWQDFSNNQRVSEAIAHIEHSGSWVMIGGAQIDNEYNLLLNQLVDEIESLTDTHLREQITWIDAFIFIGSPNSVTHYHIDSETNFLFQIHGTKEVHLFDQNDRTVLTEIELERFYVGRQNAASFKPEYEKSSIVYDFKPGTGIHIPVNAPHWVKNLDDYSVTLSVLFYTRPHDARARVYQMNHVLRYFGLKPTPPGESKIKDRLKSDFLKAVSPRAPVSKHEVLHGGINRLKRLLPAGMFRELH